MPLTSKGVGASTRAFDHAVDARWVMAYSAGLGDDNPSAMDTADGVVMAHPLFPVALEWPAILALRSMDSYAEVTAQESARGVHAAHDLHLLRPIRAGDELRTTATLIGIEAIKPGAAQHLRLDTVNVATGELIARTYQLSISRGVAIQGNDVHTERGPPVPTTRACEPLQSWSLPISAQAAHIYTECARIFNPIHTDRAVALAAGLPDIILHGTATLAYAVSALVNELLAGESQRVRRIGGRFSAMVLMPSTVRLIVLERTADTLFFEVHNEQGAIAFSQGFLVFE